MSAIIYNALFFIIELFKLFLAIIIIVKFKIKNNKSKSGYIIFGIFVGIFICFFQLFYFGINRVVFQRSVLIGLSFDVLIFLFVILTVLGEQNKFIENQKEVFSKSLQQQKDYYMMLLEKYKETNNFRHDIKNHFYCIYRLLQNKEYEKLDYYFQDVKKSFSDIEINSFSGNYIIDSIIAFRQAQYKDIKLHWEGHVPYDLPISDMSLCTIFSNLLSNAFEAVSEIEDKNVYVNVKICLNSLYLSVENKFYKKPIIEAKKLISSKEESGHGYGIENIIRCVNENNGSFEWHVEGNTFTAEVVLLNDISGVQHRLPGI